MGWSLMFSWEEEEEVVAVWRIKTLGTFSNNDTSQPPSLPATHFSLSWELLLLMWINTSLLFWAFMLWEEENQRWFYFVKIFAMLRLHLYINFLCLSETIFHSNPPFSPYPPFDLKNKCLWGKFGGNSNKTQKQHIEGCIFNGKKYESFGWTE